MLKRIFPFLVWLREYTPSKFVSDLIGGTTVALVLIPQSMAYAQLVGLPIYYGLYAAFLPPMVASLFGSSRLLATGPVAIVSLLCAAMLEPLATAGSDSFVAYAIALALMVGAFQFLLGVLRLGVVVNFLAHPVIAGFTNAGAIIIATSQLDKIFGVSVDAREHHFQTLIDVISAAMNFTYWPTFGIAILAMVIMTLIRRFIPRVPGVLVAVVICTFLSWQFSLQHRAYVHIDQIKSDNTIKMIIDYNSLVHQIDQKVAERVVATNKLINERGGASKHNIEVLYIERQIDKINFEIDDLKEKSGVLRHYLRSLKFIAIQENDKQLFYIQDNVAVGYKGDSRVWRLRIRNNELAPDNIIMNGGGSIVGDIPRGMPKIGIPKLSLGMFYNLLVPALIVSLIGFMEAISLAKGVANKIGVRLDPNQELIGQGLANIVGSFGQSYPVSGSFSQSALSMEAGSVTGMAGVFTGTVVLIVLLFFTQALFYLPKSVLAAIIMMSVVRLIDFKEIKHIWIANRADGIIAVVTFVAILIFAPHLDKGLAVGFVLSIVFHLYHTMKPKVVELSTDTMAIPTDIIDNSLQDVEIYKYRTCVHITIIRFDGSLIFANSSYLEEKVLDCVTSKPKLNNMIFIGDGINSLDATGEEMLENIVIRLREKNIGVSLCGLKDQVLDVLKRTGLIDLIGPEHIHKTVINALLAVYPRAHERHEDETDCPLKRLIYYKSFDAARHYRVLLVDDEQDFTRILSQRMNLRELDTITAFDGSAALSKIETERPDVVVLDLNMPGMDGMEILKKIKTEHPAIEVIIVTGHATEEKEKIASELGAFGFLKKPININTLIKTVENAYAKIAVDARRVAPVDRTFN